MINPLTYFWRDGMSLETAPTRELIQEHYYLKSALQPEKWWKLLSGKSHIGIGGVLRMVGRRLRISGRKVASAVANGTRQSGPSHPQVEDLTTDLKRAVSSKRQLSLFFSTTDPGYSILVSQAGLQARRMLRRGQLTVEFIDNADHTFSRQAARQNLIEVLSRHLQRRYGLE
jgi:hypothetical protein